MPGIPFESLSRALLDWFAVHGRPMAWRETRDPYRIWLSEIMLQQTQVATVAPYYDRFLESFPDLPALADADPDEVMKRWEGLGYYSRARNLHRCAGLLVREGGGRFPEDAGSLARLPGIGRSTAGAIAAIAFGKDEPILDGNVRRVVARIAAVAGDAGSSDVSTRLWDVSRKLVLPGRGRDIALAMMDLGATVCVPRRPACGECPLSSGCLAFAAGTPEAFPGRRAAKRKPVRETVAAVVVSADGRVLVRRRPDDGLLGGLFEFPGVDLREGETEEGALARWGREARLGRFAPLRRLGTVRQPFTHFDLRLHAWRCEAGCREAADGSRWVDRAELAHRAFPRAHRKVMTFLEEASQ